MIGDQIPLPIATIQKLNIGSIESSSFAQLCILKRPSIIEMPFRNFPYVGAILVAEIPGRGTYLCETLEQAQRIYDYVELYLVAGTRSVAWLLGRYAAGAVFTSVAMDEELPLTW